MDRRPGRVGRKSHYHELNVAEILKLSEKTVRECLEDKSVPIQTRAELGMKFISKHLPDKVSVSMTQFNLSETTINRILSLMESENPKIIQVEPTTNSVPQITDEG